MIILNNKFKFLSLFVKYSAQCFNRRSHTFPISCCNIGNFLFQNPQFWRIISQFLTQIISKNRMPYFYIEIHLTLHWDYLFTVLYEIKYDSLWSFYAVLEVQHHAEKFLYWIYLLCWLTVSFRSELFHLLLLNWVWNRHYLDHCCIFSLRFLVKTTFLNQREIWLFK